MTIYTLRLVIIQGIVVFVMIGAGMASAAQADYYLKIDDVKGETSTTSSSGRVSDDVLRGEVDDSKMLIIDAVNVGASAPVQVEILPVLGDDSVKTNTSTIPRPQYDVKKIEGTGARVSTSTIEDGVKKDDDAGRSKVFVLPHVVERSGVRVAVGDVNGDGISDRASIYIDGATVRGWDDKQKAEVKARLEANDTKNEANDFGLYVAMRALEHDAIVNITVNEDGIDSGVPQVELLYTTTVRFLGFLKREVRMVAEADQAGNVRVRYDKSSPLLMRLLSVKGDQSKFIDIVKTLKTRHDMVKNSIQNIR